MRIFLPALLFFLGTPLLPPVLVGESSATSLHPKSAPAPAATRPGPAPSCKEASNATPAPAPAKRPPALRPAYLFM